MVYYKTVKTTDKTLPRERGNLRDRLIMNNSGETMVQCIIAGRGVTLNKAPPYTLAWTWRTGWWCTLGQVKKEHSPLDSRQINTLLLRGGG